MTPRVVAAANSHRAARGMTLAEILVALAIVGVMSTAIFSFMAGSISGFSRDQRATELSQNAAAAADEISSKLVRAGFGLPGKYLIGSRAVNNATTGACAGTDILHFRGRSAEGFWSLTSATNASMTIASNRVPNWPKWQGLFVYSSPGRFGLAQTSALRTGAAISPVPAAATTTLVTASSADMSDTTIATAGAEVHAINDFVFRLDCSVAAHPTLVFESQLDEDNNGVIDMMPVASDIEDLQVAYLLDADGDGNVTAANGVALPSTDAERQTIRSIRFTIVARSAEPVEGISSVRPANEDRAAASSADRYLRRVLRHTIMLDNRDTTRPMDYQHFSNRLL